MSVVICGNLLFQGQFAPVKGSYSPEFRDLIMDMLQKEPEGRPSANEIMYQRLPLVRMISIGYSFVCIFVCLFVCLFIYSTGLPPCSLL